MELCSASSIRFQSCSIAQNPNHQSKLLEDQTYVVRSSLDPRMISSDLPPSSPETAKAISGLDDGSEISDVEKSAPPPATCSIPPEMLSSCCPVRVSFRFPPLFDERSILEHRYTVWHTGMHYKHLLDNQGPDCTLKITTQTKVCLSGGSFSVHCLTCSSSEGKWVEISAHCPHGENPFGCKCIDDTSLESALSETEFQMYQNDTMERLNKLHEDNESEFALVKESLTSEITLQMRSMLENCPAKRFDQKVYEELERKVALLQQIGC